MAAIDTGDRFFCVPRDRVELPFFPLPIYRHNVARLACSQALAMTINTILITVAALVGFALAADKALATLPLALRQIATMAMTIPAALLLRQWGRRPGFVLGGVTGCISALVGLESLRQQSFWLFCVALGLNGAANGFVGYYRFAAADAAPVEGRAQAVSWVVAGGVVAAVAGPWLSTRSQGWFPGDLYQGAWVVILVLQGLVVLLLAGLQLPESSAEEQRRSGRPLAQIMAQPVFLVAVIGSMIGYGLMTLVMTATPLAMAAVDHPFPATATVIQWHVLGMFAPAFITGHLIRRFGTLAVLQAGALLTCSSLAINLLGTGFWHFASSLLLLGVGWNFMFVGATTLLTTAYTPAEKAKTQAAHDFLMFSFVALTTYLSGQLFHSFSWHALNSLGWPLVGLSVAATLWLQRQKKCLTP